MAIERLSEVWSELQRIAKEEHVLAIGATSLADEHASVFEEWLERGYAASMRYLERNAAVRRDPASRFPWARSAVAILVPYSAHRPADDSLASGIARYAQGDDYHEVLDTILKRFEATLAELDPGIITRRYVDTGPLSDRSLATRAGLGWIGRNAMLIHEEYGSYFFIGVLLTSLVPDVEPERVTDRCGTCTRCVDACPTDAIAPGRLVDANRCISHATIEQRGPLDDAMKPHLGANLFGCDICQEVCPWNRKAPEPHPAFVTRDAYRATPVTDLLRMHQEEFSTLFRKSAVKRAKRSGMVRNAVILLRQPSNSSDLQDDPGVADACKWIVL